MSPFTLTVLLWAALWPAWPQSAPQVAPASPFVTQLEVARQHDLRWRFAEVEPAIAEALVRLRDELLASPPPAPAPGRLVAGGEVPLPAKIRDAAAEYPARAYIDGITGVVIVEAEIDRRGEVRQARAAKSIPGLDDAAIRAVRRWRFAPTVRDGQTVDVISYLPVRFGSSRDLTAADWLELARFFYERRLLSHAVASMEIARDRARRDFERYGTLERMVATASRPIYTPPSKVKDVPPVYPPLAQQGRVSGRVILEAVIDPFGHIGRVRVLKPVPMLDLAAEEAVLQWKYTPFKLNGEPRSLAMTVTVTFSLK